MKKSNGIKVHFNRHNTYGDEPCCCQKGYCTKYGASTLFCIVCNLFCLRKLTKTNSFCKKKGWDKDCRTCQQIGNYDLWGKNDR